MYCNAIFAQDKLLTYLSNDIIYPDLAAKKNVSGIVNVNIHINEKGELIHSYIIDGIGDGCRDSILNSIQKIKSWNDYVTGWHQDVVIQIPFLFINNNNIDVLKFPKILMDTIRKTNIIKSNRITEPILEYVENMPEFPGGEDALMNFLASNLNYPSKAISNNTHGQVVVSFVINEEGNITSPKIIKGLGDGCDEEALRVISKLPKWSPGYQNKKAVKVIYNLPITFELEEDGNGRNPLNSIKKDTVKIYSNKNLKPIFPNGKNGFKDSLYRIIISKIEKIKERKPGIIEATFIIDEHGAYTNVVFNKSINSEFENLIKTSIQLLPKCTFNSPTKTPTTYTIVIPFE